MVFQATVNHSLRTILQSGLVRFPYSVHSGLGNEVSNEMFVLCFSNLYHNLQTMLFNYLGVGNECDFRQIESSF